MDFNNDTLIKTHACEVKVATPYDNVLNTECVYTFHNPYSSEKGIVVNMCTFIGTIEEMAFQNVNQDFIKEAMFLRIVKERIIKEKKEGETEERSVSKLGIGVEGGFSLEDDKFNTISKYSIVVLRKNKGDNSVSIVTEVPYNEKTKRTFPRTVIESADSIIHHAGWATKQDVKAWELDEEKFVSKYCDNLPFVDNGVVISPNPSDWKCEKSGHTENLWLNLSDGYIGGGRKHWDGSGGSNGALDHFLETGEKYPLVVKLGTISADLETADCYSYAKDEDGPVKVSNLEELLQKRGIRMGSLKKTEKSTAELEVELNASYAFDAITESGANLSPISGPGYQGLQNLGNSCYINSSVQVLFSIAELRSRYGIEAGSTILKHPLFHNVTPKQALTDLLAQTSKLASALSGGYYANPSPPVDFTSSDIDPKYRIAPRMFKQTIGKNHPDFCTNQQQDAAQFLLYFLEQLERAELAAQTANTLPSSDPLSTKLFSYQTTSRLVCSADNLVKYKGNSIERILSLRIPMEEAFVAEDEAVDEKSDADKPIPSITLDTCLKHWAASTTIQGYSWPHLHNAKHDAISTMRFSNFPRYLVIQLQRYELGADWTAKKLEVKVQMPQEIDLESLRIPSTPQEGETLIPEDGDVPTVSNSPVLDENAIAQLMDMGFGLNGCKRALLAVGGSNVEAAMNWIFEHNNDPDFNDPLPDSNVVEMADGDVDEAVVASLTESLGCFTMDQVRASLKETKGSVERAADWLFSHMDDLDNAVAAISSNKRHKSTSSSSPSSEPDVDDGPGKYRLFGMISHIGKNTGSGHYVCHIKKDGNWAIYNDEKVGISKSPPFEHAYLYFFERI